MNEPPFALRGIDHVVLRVHDLERMRDFYCGVLGCTLERRQADIGLWQLRAGASLIDLVDARGPIGRKDGAPPGEEGHNMDHFCLRVDQLDPDALQTWLQAHDVQAGPLERRYGAEGEGLSLYLHDPEGNQLELKGPRNPEN